MAYSQLSQDGIRSLPERSYELSPHNRNPSQHDELRIQPQWHSPVSRQNPVALSKSLGYVVMRSIWDFLIAIVPIAFIVIALLAASIDGDLRSKRGDQIQVATTLIPTIFPIVFAALMGHFFRIYGTYRAERGVRLGTLEQLIGSHSFFSAFERQMLLRDFGYLGLLIMAVWSLSPVGGQAGLRLLSTSLESVDYNTTNWYLSPTSIRDSAFVGNSAMNTAGDLITSIYTSSLMGSETTSGTGMDLWGNVKIPDINTLQPGKNKDDWRTVDSNSTVQFSSLLGLPVGRSTFEGNSTFTVTSQYFDVQCSNNILSEKQDLASLSYNLVNASSGPGHSLLTFFPDPMPKLTDEVGGDLSSRAKLMFGSRTQKNDNHTWSLSNCTIGNLAVDSKIACEGQKCHVSAMRAGKQEENYDGLTHLLNNSLLFLPTASDRDRSSNYLYSSTLTERWMNDTSLLYEGGRLDMDLWKLDPKTLSARLATVINTYWQAGFANKYRGSSLPTSATVYEKLRDCSNTAEEYYCFVPVPATGTRHSGEVYICHRAWLGVFLTICIVLQIMALGAVVLKRLTLAPDILGYVSSYTRDNPHTPVPGGTFQDGLARSRLLKDVRVMLGDVRSAEQVGHISFVAQGEHAAISRLKKGRRYI
ncbi:hypothetical protein FQN53_005047 [Emmonsiellopsis sp. PD_33]|nr:hypothetical protein FQN53_005047 [Emmonsiellopsis sp. PD_33]